MNKRLSCLFTSIAAFALAGLLVFTGATMLKANAQEDPEPEPTPVHESGWYIVGNGAGTLKTCSWTEYLADYRVTGIPYDTENYTGRWTTPEIMMYPGDAFKLLYNDGSFETPDDSKWGEDIQAQFSNIAVNTDEDFVNGGLGNIEARVAGYYTFTLTVMKDAETGKVTLTLSFDRAPNKVPPEIDLYDMYVVGTIASRPACNWPGVTDVTKNCIKMDYDPLTKKYTATVTLVATDEFKVYNLISNSYFPSGVNNNYKGYTGEYIIEWGLDAPDILVTPVEPEQPGD